MHDLLDTFNTIITIAGIAFFWWLFFCEGWSRIADHFLGPQVEQVKTGDCDDGEEHDFDDWSDPTTVDSGPQVQSRTCWNCNLAQTRRVTDV